MTKKAKDELGSSRKKAEAKDVTELSEVYREGAMPKARGERFGRVESLRNSFAYHASPGSDIKAHLHPKFWALLARQLRPLDRIEVTEELGAWTAQLIVRSVNTEVDVAVVSYTRIGGIQEVGAKPALPSGHRVAFGGIHSRWGVFDGQSLLRDGLPNEKAAETWLQDHLAMVTGNPGAAA